MPYALREVLANVTLACQDPKVLREAFPSRSTAHEVVRHAVRDLVARLWVAVAVNAGRHWLAHVVGFAAMVLTRKGQCAFELP